MTHDHLRYKMARGIGLIPVEANIAPGTTCAELVKAVHHEREPGSQQIIYEYLCRIMADYIDESFAAKE